MSAKRANEQEDDETSAGVAVEAEGAGEGGDEAELAPLQLSVDIKSPSACERRVAVTIPRDDINRYFDKAYGELMPSSAVPGFRVGRAPRKIVEHRYKDQVSEQVKSSLLMDSLSQLGDDKRFTAISEPNFDLDAIEVPEDGPMTFEFTIEVRPEFDMPEWKGLKLKRLKRDFTDADVEEQLEQMLARYGQLAPYDGAASSGDYLTVSITASHDGKQVAHEPETVVRIRPTLSFTDGKLEGFDKLMKGVKAGDKKSAKMDLTQDAPNAELRGRAIEVEFQVLDVKQLKLPELTEEFLQEIGNFKTEQELRDAIRQNLERQVEYQTQQDARRQITALLTKSADWELPPGLLDRQSARELERAVMELRRSGFSEAEIRARENQLRQNSKASTATALKEHFILERIAEEENVDAEEGDYEKEIFLIAMQSGESPRRVRAQLEKRGLMDVLRNQIVERKVLERVQKEAKFKDEKYEPPKADTEAISMAAGGGSGAAIPSVTEAKEDADEK
jgi:trigger factor